MGLERRNPDFDADRPLDGAEVHVLGTDPRLPGTNGDGAADGVDVAPLGRERTAGRLRPTVGFAA
jgi:hypothetical protein